MKKPPRRAALCLVAEEAACRHIRGMSRYVWMAVQGTIIAVPLYWLVTDPSALQEPQLIIGVLILVWLISLTVTEGLTRLYDWCRFRLWPLVHRAFGHVRQSQRKADCTIASRGSVRKLP